MCVAEFFLLKWIRRNTNVNFVIKISDMDKVETDMKGWYIFHQGKCVKGRETIVVRGPIGEAAPAALTP